MVAGNLQSLQAKQSLRRSWALFALLSIAYLAAGWYLLRTVWQADAALNWVILASVTLIYLLIVLWRNLDQNRRPDEEILLPGLGWGNWTTLLRGVLVASLIGFLFLPRPSGWLTWLPAILYSLAIMADSLDGYLARRSNYTTSLGGILDMSFDGLGVLAAAILLVQYGQVPSWYILVGLARYLFLLGEWVLRRLGRSPQPLQHNVQRRIFASIQFVFIAVLLYPVFPPTLTQVAAVFFGLPFLIGFWRDFLLVCGVLRPKSTPAIPARFLAAIQIGIRLALVVLALLVLRQMQPANLALDREGAALLFLQLFMALAVLLGIAGRISSGIALGLIGLGQWFFPPTILQIFQIAGYAAIIYMGVGPYSHWSPEEAWYYKPTGLTRPGTAQKPKNETLPQAH